MEWQFIRYFGKFNFYMSPITMRSPTVRARNPTRHKRYMCWKSCELAWGSECGILISSCGIKICISPKYKSAWLPSQRSRHRWKQSNPTWHERFWRSHELVWGDECGILISSCGIKVNTSRKYKSVWFPSQWSHQRGKQAILRDTNAVGDHMSSSGVTNVEF